MFSKSCLKFSLDVSLYISTACPLCYTFTLNPNYSESSSFLYPGTLSATGAKYTTLPIYGFLIWVSPSVAFTNPFPLTVVSHYFKSLSLHSSHTVSPLCSLCTCYFKRKLRSLCGNYLCILAVLPSIRQLHLTTLFLSSNLKGSGGLPAIEGRGCVWFCSLSLMPRLLPLVIFLFVLDLQLCLLCWPLSFNLYTFFKLLSKKSKSTNKNELTSLFTRFHCCCRSISLPTTHSHSP